MPQVSNLKSNDDSIESILTIRSDNLNQDKMVKTFEHVNNDIEMLEPLFCEASSFNFECATIHLDNFKERIISAFLVH